MSTSKPLDSSRPHLTLVSSNNSTSTAPKLDFQHPATVSPSQTVAASSRVKEGPPWSETLVLEQSLPSFLPSVIRSLDRYCFSTSGGFGIGVSKGAAYVWDITNLAARFVETFTLHDSNISSLVFSSSFQHPATNWSDSGRSVALPRTKP